MSLARLAAAALLLSTGTAAAQAYVATGVPTPMPMPMPMDDGRDGYARPPAPRRIEARAGMLLGGSDVGDADGFSLGVTTGIGYRIGDLTVRGRFDHYRVGDSSDEGSGEQMVRRGRGTRIGGALRYSFANTGESDRHGSGMGVDFWGEVGAGIEHVSWRQGGVLDRPSGEFALGFELDGYGRRRADGSRRHGGYFMAFRTFLGQGPEMDGPATCGGPCSRATKPSRVDASMFFELGFHWGR
ncbi:MAG TPA: hypothetical protein VNO30_17860 [Kofleriaceae bacterium]|nr:hypothetical protein [Kofleriaceae bacterium]